MIYAVIANSKYGTSKWIGTVDGEDWVEADGKLRDEIDTWARNYPMARSFTIAEFKTTVKVNV